MYLVPDSEWSYRRRKYSNNLPKTPKNQFRIEETSETKRLLKKFLIGLKSDSKAVKIRIIQVIQRIQLLETLTSDIIEKMKKYKPDIKVVKYKDAYEIQRKVKNKEMEERINSLEEWLKETNIRLNSSEEKRDALMIELNKLNSEMQMMKLACVEIIHHELSKAGVLFDDYGTPLPREFHQGKGDSKVRKVTKRVKKFT